MWRIAPCDALHFRSRVYTVFIDYKKAFDFIEGSSLWHKVLSDNINGKLFNEIHTMYSSAKPCMKTKTQEGTCLQVRLGYAKVTFFPHYSSLFILITFNYSYQNITMGSHLNV